MENQLIEIVDELVPLTEVHNEELPSIVPPFIRNKTYLRKWIRKSNKQNTTVEKTMTIKRLNLIHSQLPTVLVSHLD